MSNTFKGQIKAIGETQQVTDKFKKREIALQSEGEYPQVIGFQLSQAHTDKADGLQIGQTVTVHYNLRGREWTNPQGEVKYFNTLDVWKIENEQANQPQANAKEEKPTEDMPF